MLRDLPELIYPLRLAHAGRSLCGRVTLARMRRLQPLLAQENEGSAQVALHFGSDDSGYPGVQCAVRADLNLICQRCLNAVPFSVKSEIRLRIVSADDRVSHSMERTPSDFEPLIIARDEAVALSDIVEDELLLVLPMAPMHPKGVCSISQRYAQMKLLREKRKNPFSALVVDKPTRSNHEE